MIFLRSISTSSAHSSTVRSQKYFVVAVFGIVTIGAGISLTELPLALRILGPLLLTALFGVFFHFFPAGFRWTARRSACCSPVARKACSAITSSN